MKSYSLVFLLIAVSLFLTNPAQDEYVSWVGHQAPQSGEQTGLEKVLLALVVSPVVAFSTQRENFGLFSIFTTTLDRNTFRTIGFFHHFVLISPLETAWTPGVRFATSPHVIATKDIDRWAPEDGYVWVVAPPNGGDFRVQWNIGRPSTTYPHVVTANEEGRWLPEDGYRWLSDPPPNGDLRVRWMVGQASKLHPQVIASGREGHWLPAKGYAWVNNPPTPGDFRVRAVAPSTVEEGGLIKPFKAKLQFPFYHGRPVRNCTYAELKSNERLYISPCYYIGSSGIYVASHRGSNSAATFSRWPDIDNEEDGQ